MKQKQQRKPIKFRNPYYPRFNEDDEAEVEEFERYNDMAQEEDFRYIENIDYEQRH